MTYALIGCGRIAVNHIKAALNNKLNIVAVCDVLPEKMEELLTKYDLQNDDSIARYTDYKKLLAEHPEGIVLYDRSRPHAVLLTDYTDGVFYCSDPAGNISSGRIPLTPTCSWPPSPRRAASTPRSPSPASMRG